MKKIFLDLDGTLAKFNVPNALNRFEKEKGFFFRLKPYKGVEVIDPLCKTHPQCVYIISASPNLAADIDKIKWVRKYIPSLPYNNIIICRCGENKANAIRRKLGFSIDKECYLLDDYTKNLTEWEQAGGRGIKRITSVADNSTKKWQGLELKELEKLEEVLNYVNL